MLAAWGLAAALVVALTPVIAASTSAPYSISGIEYAASSTEGKFAGVAVAADDLGTWLTVVDHTAISGGTATITGGAFSYDGRVRDVQGSFTRGSLTQTGGFTGCVNQTFAVAGVLALVVPTGGTGAFNATLTHYQTRLFGRCITYAATVKGRVVFTFP